MKTILKAMFCLLPLLVLAGCTPPLRPGSTLELAEQNRNSVTVKVALEIDAGGQAWLAATFTPADPALHLYSKDLPKDGVNGLGRPTLLELVPGTRLEAAGGLVESTPAQPGQDPDGLAEYPAGPVTLRLPVRLPEGRGWFDERVSVTYMACQLGACHPPVENELIPVHIPGEEEITR
ncbi:MAG TPA: hypothetical protein VMC09_14815 [Anaerolineales bacterium]|nr:hypothetical protein [Anaerolineales bacterium]